MASIPTAASSSSPRSIQVTVHRCTDMSNDMAFGTRGYFVKATIGDMSQQTTDRQVDERTHIITWNETFTFNNTTSSSMTLRVYRRRALRTSKLIEKLTVGIRDDANTTPSALPRAFTFEAGPKIEFTLQARKMDTPVHAVEQGGKIKGNTEEAVAEARRALKIQRSSEPSFKRVLEGIKGFHAIADPIAEVHPYARIACAILWVLTDPFIEQLDRDEQVQSLLDSFANFCETVIGRKDSDLGGNTNLKDVLKRAGIQLTEVAYFVQEYCRDGSFLRRALKNKMSGVYETIGEYQAKLDELKEEFNLKLSIETAVIVSRTIVKVVLILNKVDELAQAVNLDDLNYVLGAGLDTDKICLTGTRISILDEIVHWASFDGSRVLLLCGGAGTGKSSIAHTIAVRFKELGRLGSVFCFSRTEQATRKPASLFPHIARDLADLHPNIRTELCKVIANKADRTASGIATQFEKLVLLPAQAIRAHLHGPIVIVIDALDEAGTVSERKKLLEVLSSRLGELPPNFRVVITSRPERDIEQKFGKGPDITIKRMEAIPSDMTTQDIAKFVESQFADDPEVSTEIQQDLVVKAQDLFQWAFVASQFILEREPKVTAWDRYQAVTPPPTKKPVPSLPPHAIDVNEDEHLNRLYRIVLSEALTTKGSVPIDHFKFVMARILSAFAPLSCKSLNRLIAASKCAPQGCTVEKIVASFGSLLSGVDDHDTPIAPLHISFRDFLTDFERSGEFFVDLDDPMIHTDMARASLSIMKEELRFNICRLPTSHLANQDIRNLDDLIKQYIPPHLVYASRSWTSHFCLVPSTMHNWRQLTDEVGQLVENRVLYWLEVLSLLGASDSGLRDIRRVYSWMNRAKNVKQDILDLVQDLELFWSYFSKCISRSAPHIYISALPFAPKESLVAKLYTALNHKALSIPVGRLKKYPACINVFQAHTSSVSSVAVSPDGTRIVSGSYDKTLRVWNTENGEVVLGPMSGHGKDVRSVAFSPDGSRIVSGSRDHTIRIWDAENGKMKLGPLNGHTDSVSSVAMSADGTRIVSGSYDNTVCIWDAESGQMLLGPLKGHVDEINSVAFSPDGARIISGADDETVRIWNADNGEMILDPLKGHTGWVLSVAFSPDGTHIISGSQDKTIRIWNVENGQVTVDPLTGHTDYVYSVAFSPDGTRIISGSSDRTIRIWDAGTGQMLLGPLSGHTDYVYAVAFLPDGFRVISGSRDCTIRMWNSENGETELDPPNGHASPVISVSFSPDGTRIISSSDDKTVRIWNASNGEMALSPPLSHTAPVFSVAFSSDGTRIVSGSDNAVRIWNAADGKMLLGPLNGHTDPIWSVAFSPDGHRIISGSFDETIRVWDADNGELLLGPLHGHTDSIWSVAFSPDGSQIASGSDDNTVRLWNAKNGEMLLSPMDSHTGSVRSVAFSPDGTRIISGSSDNTIRIWNAETGQVLLGPLNGHTNWVTSVKFSLDGTRIISASADKTIRIWSAEDGQMVLGPLTGHTNWILSAAFSPDGTRCVSGSHDSVIRVWDLQTKTATGELLNHSWTIESDWVLDADGDLLCYVPPAQQRALHTPRTIFCIGTLPLHLGLTHFAHGPSWEESYSHLSVR